MIRRVLWTLVCLAGLWFAIDAAETTARWWVGVFYIAAAVGWLCFIVDPPQWVQAPVRGERMPPQRTASPKGQPRRAKKGPDNPMPMGALRQAILNVHAGADNGLERKEAIDAVLAVPGVTSSRKSAGQTLSNMIHDEELVLIGTKTFLP